MGARATQCGVGVGGGRHTTHQGEKRMRVWGTLVPSGRVYPLSSVMQAVGRFVGGAGGALLSAAVACRAPLLASAVRPALCAVPGPLSAASGWLGGGASRGYSVTLPTAMTVSRTHPGNHNPQAHPVPTKVVEAPLDIAKGPKGKNLPGRAPLGPRLNEYERRVSGLLGIPMLFAASGHWPVGSSPEHADRGPRFAPSTEPLHV